MWKEDVYKMLALNNNGSIEKKYTMYMYEMLGKKSVYYLLMISKVSNLHWNDEIMQKIYKSFKHIHVAIIF